jgi:acetyltransferase-like isoleucine patch superfamily enzyme
MGTPGAERQLGPIESWASRFKLRKCAQVGKGVRVKGQVWIHGGGRVVIGDGVELNGPIELNAAPGAEIVLGENVRIDAGTSLESLHSIVVGPNCHLKGFCKVLDNHFHAVRGNRHERPQSERVVLEEGVRVGERSIVLPGAHLQKGVELLEGTVVSRKVPPGVTLSGHPAKLVRRGT